MKKPYKDLLRSIVTQLRRLLGGYWDEHGDYQRGDLDRELERLGFDPTGKLMPLDGLRNPTPVQVHAHRVVTAQLATLPADASNKAVINLRNDIVERAAYSWINRLLALRTMEARGLLEETLRPSYDGVSEALFILRETAPQRTTGPDGGWWAILEDACTALTPILPGLFDLTDPNVALRPSTPVLLEAIKLVGGNHPSLSRIGEGTNEALFQDPDVIGWAYQFYQEEAKARVYAKLGKGGKVETRSEIAAATQLFTESYMVQWMLQNSLGRTYHEAYPTSKLPETWAYYIRPELTNEQPSGHSVIFPLDQLTFLDIAMGSGHILREAFDMFFAMYREQHTEMTADEIVNRILTHHLHGIDIDPRAAQLAALTLVLRAYEQCSRPLAAGGLGRGLNLATTPTGLDSGALERHLARHPEDELYRPILVGLFAALEHAPILGSLLRPGEHLDEAIAAFKSQHKGGQLGLAGESTSLNRLLDELARHNPTALKAMLLESISRSFLRDAQKSDVGALLLGRAAVAGLHLLELLERKYAVVVTNPPYMGSGNMSSTLRDYIDAKYKYGKRDLYAAFIERCAQFCVTGGFIAMITLESWLQKSTYSVLRSYTLSELRLNSMVVLGRHAFTEADPPGLPVMFVLKRISPTLMSTFWGKRLGLSLDAESQSSWLIKQCRILPQDRRWLRQNMFQKLPNQEILLDLTPKLLSLLTEFPKISGESILCEPLTTGDNTRYVHFIWEHYLGKRWMLMSKGGGTRRWRGLEYYVIDWEHQGTRVKAFPNSYVRNEEWMFESGLTFSAIARLGVTYRQLAPGMTFGKVGPGIFPPPSRTHLYLATLNSSLYNYLLKTLNPGASIILGNVGQLPVPQPSSTIQEFYTLRLQYSILLYSLDLTESIFDEEKFLTMEPSGKAWIAAIAASLDGLFSQQAQVAFDLDEESLSIVNIATGTLSGLYPFIAEYDSIPKSPTALNLPPLPQTLQSCLSAHTRIHLNATELNALKTTLRYFYEAGPGVRSDDLELEISDEQANREEIVIGAYIPTPTETFLEELSVKLQVHPISIYWLVEELRSAGVRCKPEEQRLIEDRLTVLVLRLLGHRWPKQIETNEPVPAWADTDGIIPLTPNVYLPSGERERTLAERLHERLCMEDGDLGAQRIEALLQELTSCTLTDWLRRDFFKRHVSQFKKRPIAWHLQSTPVTFQSGGRSKRRGARQEPAFECFIYYHRCDTDILARIRTQYVEPVLSQDIRRQTEARRALLSGVTDSPLTASGEAETVIAQASARIQELQEFTERLRAVESQGFAYPELAKLLADEPLDRWSGDGQHAPTDYATLLAQEQAWRVDINDGVRVNIAPLQKAGILAQEVLNRQDVPKAIADRARWRADERRWVRQGKLPRCGWMSQSIPESAKWTELAPEREAEGRRLEEKRQQVLAELDQE